jgi:hypothetical protein
MPAFLHTDTDIILAPLPLLAPPAMRGLPAHQHLYYYYLGSIFYLTHSLLQQMNVMHYHPCSAHPYFARRGLVSWHK